MAADANSPHWPDAGHPFLPTAHSLPMATDFFQRQSDAHRYTKWLVVLFLLAVVGIVATVFFATMAALGAAPVPQEFSQSDYWAEAQADLDIPIAASLGVLGLILLGSLYKIAQLRGGGGTVVAERLGGRRIYPNTTDPLERRVLNVVEEMAIASGVPVPPVYMLPGEKGINAFAAGYSTSDAVVAVTRGTAEQLSRDQLQGVVAHEFSHILNGDMRLNIRLIGVLNGILLLGLLGRMLLQSMRYSTSSRSKNNGALLAILLVGLAIMVLGYIGTFFGGLIKAAVSRQREFLADASAVQFTRNPGGIAGALKRIGAAVFGSKIASPNASEASHMFFANGVWAGLTGLMATHPPLDKRILRIEPNWDGKFPKPLPSDMAAAAEAEVAAGLVGAGAGARPSGVIPTAVVLGAANQVGNPTEQHRAYAAKLVDALPPQVVEAAREPYGARAVLYCLLLDRQDSVRQVQLDALRKHALPDVVKLTDELAPQIDGLDIRARLPLVDMALPALRAMSPSQYTTFSTCFEHLVRADNRLGLFEWCLYQILLRHLRPQFQKVRPPIIRYYGLQRLGQPCSVLFSALAHTGQGAGGAQAALDAADRLLPELRMQLLPAEGCGLEQLDEALDRLARVSAKQRRRLIDAAAACICADAEVKASEAELLRAVCDMLDCPMPPLLPGQPVGNAR